MTMMTSGMKTMITEEVMTKFRLMVICVCNNIETIITLLCYIICVYTIIMCSKPITEQTVTVSGWNVHGIRESIPYIKYLLSRSDVLVINEHWLCDEEVYKLNDIDKNFLVTAKAGTVSDLSTTHSWGGVGIFWTKQLDKYVKVETVESRRICAIQVLNINKNPLYIIGVYLPHVACKADLFTDVLLILEDFVNKCVHSNGELLIIGDMNCHFGKGAGPRCWGKTSNQASEFLKFIERNLMEVVDISQKCVGPCFTYQVGCKSSYIDHIALSKPLMDSVVHCEVITDSILNTSDHLAITISVKTVTPKEHEIKQNEENSKIAWYKLKPSDVQAYTHDVESELSEILTTAARYRYELEKVDINKLHDNIVNTLQKCSEHLPKQQFNSKLKPYWDIHLTLLNKEKKKITKKWKEAGMPRNEDNIIWYEYKQAKREFRREQRKKEYEYEVKCMREVAEESEVNSNFYWHLINKSRKCVRKRISPVYNTDGQVLTSSDDIRSRWLNYFKDLFTPKSPENLDHQFGKHIEEEVQKQLEESYLKEGPDMKMPFNVDEIMKCMKLLKFKKATGYDGISSEHVRHGGNNLCILLEILFNAICEQETMPMGMRRGILVPIPKPKKDYMDCDNNRGLTLLTTFQKLFQHILKARSENLFMKHIDELQGAGKKTVSCINTSMLLRETIAMRTEDEKPVFIAFLDTKKAFDSVWHNGLMYKLYKMGMDPKMWRLLRNMYSDFKCAVLIDNKLSSWFNIRQGVHQGAPLSLLLYEVFINDLIVELKQFKNSPKVGNAQIPCTVFADDMSIICQSHNSMQAMLNVAYHHSQTWRYSYNAKKSEVIVMNYKRALPKFWMGKELLPVVDSAIHLGSIITNKASCQTQFIKDRIYSGNRAVLAVKGIGTSRVPMSVPVSSKLYWTISVPIMTYSMEVMDMNTQTKALFEDNHWKVAKRIQRIPENTPNAAVLPQIGWKTLGGHIAYLKLLFLWRVLLLPMNNIYKRVVVTRLLQWFRKPSDQKGPVATILCEARKYHLLADIICAVTLGVYMTTSVWKNKVKTNIYKHEWDQYCVTLPMYKKLNVYKNCFKGIRMWPWWVHASRYPQDTYKCSLLMKLITGTSKLKLHKCVNCDVLVTCPMSHMLFECVLLNEKRHILWSEWTMKMPTGFLGSLTLMSPVEKTYFIATGFNVPYTTEWLDVYSGALQYIQKMYNLYTELCETEMT